MIITIQKRFHIHHHSKKLIQHHHPKCKLHEPLCNSPCFTFSIFSLQPILMDLEIFIAQFFFEKSNSHALPTLSWFSRLRRGVEIRFINENDRWTSAVEGGMRAASNRVTSGWRNGTDVRVGQ